MSDSEIAIRVENLSKRYKIGTRGTHADELRGRLANASPPRSGDSSAGMESPESRV